MYKRQDQNYTVLVRTLQQWADLLLESGRTEDAETVLAYAVSIGTDVSHTYYALAKIYAGQMCIRDRYEALADYYQEQGYFTNSPARAYRYQILLEFARCV